MKILFFSPHQYINVHAIPEAIVAKELEKDGHEIFQVGCDGLFKENCISMSAAGVWPHDSIEKKSAICDQCKSGRIHINKRFEFRNSIIENYIKNEDLLEIEQIIKGVNIENWTSFIFDEIYVGKIASYEFLLNYKINTINIPPEHWESYLFHLRGVLITLFAGKKILQEIRPDRLVVYNNFYSLNHILCLLAEKNGVSTYSLHAGSHHKYRLSEMTVFKGHYPQFLTGKTLGWKRYEKLPLTLQGIKSAYKHIEELLTAQSPWVYSIKYSGKSTHKLKEIFGVQEHQKVLLATMASGDERFAAQLVGGLPEYPRPLFETQVDWILFLIEFAKNNNKYHLIIRVHPREFPNKRESVLSEQAKNLEILFRGLPNNVSINWPSDSISLHDLIRIVDVGLNATSTAGLEMLMFGVPVVIYDRNQLFSYPAELNLCGETLNEYVQRIEEAATDGWSMKNIYGVYKWLAFKSDVIAISIADAYKHPKITWINNLIYSIREKLKISNYFWGFIEKRESLNNNMWLTYAIVENKESHINEYVSCLENKYDLSAKIEVKLKNIIRNKTLKILYKIAKNDKEFSKKINTHFQNLNV
mgnify:CR=1 FL=1